MSLATFSQHHKKPIIVLVGLCLFLIIAISSLTIYLGSRPTHAADTANFNPGNIISDSVFFNANSMSISDIQTFLNSKVASCDTNGTQIYSGSTTRAQYSATKGISTPFTCLKDYTASTSTENADAYCNGYTSSVQSSAQMIYGIAQSCGINPQVLLVLLQKEQGLITDSWPWSTQYQKATGYACPDTAACDTTYYGLFNQVYFAARQYKLYQANPSQYSYVAGRNNNVLYNPQSSCGSSVVYIQNQATAALYNYTPYQPNSASLAAGYGSGDSCSSYGNRNFWLYFNDWFGPSALPTNTAYIANGTYLLQNPVSNRVLDVSNGNTSNGSAVWIYDRNNTAAQSWQVTRTADGFYTFKNIGSGRYLNVNNSATTNGTAVQIQDANSGCAEKWAVVNVNGGYNIVSSCSGRTLDIANGGTSIGSLLQIYDQNATAGQVWKFLSNDSPAIPNGFYQLDSTTWLPIDSTNSQIKLANSNTSGSEYWQIARQTDGTYTVRNPLTNQYLDATNSGTKPGTLLQIWKQGNNCAQSWIITPSVNGTYSIQSSCSGLSMDITGGATSTIGTPVQLYTANNTASQQWIITGLLNNVSVPDSTYTIHNIGGLALDVTGGVSDNGTKIQIWQSNYTAAQDWNVVNQPDGTVEFKNSQTGKYIDLSGGSTNAGTSLQIWTGNDTCSQKWNLIDNGNSTYTIRSSCSALLAFDVIGGQLSIAGVRTQAYTLNHTLAQQWTFDAP